jgi:hypothetical protein
MVLLVPESLFTEAGGTHVYLYSKFGVNFTPNSGFEEWAAGSGVASATGSISGTVYNCPNPQGVAGILVFIDANHDGIFNNNEYFDYTDSNGGYQFNFLAAGLGEFSKYDVTLQLPDGSTTSNPHHVVELTNDDPSVTGIDFCFQFPEIEIGEE